MGVLDAVLWPRVVRLKKWDAFQIIVRTDLYCGCTALFTESHFPSDSIKSEKKLNIDRYLHRLLIPTGNSGESRLISTSLSSVLQEGNSAVAGSDFKPA